MARPKDHEIKVRVPADLKNSIKALADKNLSSESAIARTALLEYLQRHGALSDASTPYTVNSSPGHQAAAKIVSAAVSAAKLQQPPVQKVTYKVHRRSKKPTPQK